VWYVPELCHAADVLADGTLAWDFSSTRPRDDATEALPVTEVVKMFRNGRAAQIKPLSPRCRWPAIVRAVRDGNVLDLDIEGRPPGCTFHYDRIPFSAEEGNTPHTWHHREDN
jgi:hypothetical protein